MRCLYCETDIHTYPESGTCPNCGGKLPKPAQQQFTRPLRTCSVCGAQSRSSFCPDCGRSLTASAAATPFVSPNDRPVPGRTCCPMCYSRDISFKKRGFSWGWGLLGFFLFPFLGALFGFIGYKKLRFRCHTCSYKWTLG